MAQHRFARSYDERAHRRAREARDERIGKSKGPDQRCVGALKEIDRFGGRICSSNINFNPIGQRRLSDSEFFSRFCKARFRLREIRTDDGLPQEMADLLQVLVAHSRSGLKKTFVWKS